MSVSIAALAAALCSGGCSMSGLGSIGPVAASPPAVVAPVPVAYGAFLDGPVGQKLTAADREQALSAEQEALSTDQRRTWKGEHGTFGYVEPAAAAAAVPVVSAVPPLVGDAACRGFTSTIFINGRPQVGHGRGCANPDGSYRIVG